MNKWFQIDAKADAPEAEVKLYDIIGDWIDDLFGFGDTAKSFATALAEIPKSAKTLHLRINSPGGDVFGGIAMASTLRAWAKERGAKIVAHVDGIAASAATLPMMAADEIHVPDNALVMIHNPWAGASGNADDMRKKAGLLDEIRDRIVATYQWHSELDAKDLIELMDAETWMNGEDAKTFGFATHVEQGLQATASIGKASAKRSGLVVPEKYREQYEALLKDETAPVEPARSKEIVIDDVVPYDTAVAIAACAEADLTLVFAQSLIDASATPDEIKIRIAAESARLSVEAQRETDIRALCERFEMSDLAGEMIAGGLNAEAARRLVASVKAKLDLVEIDAGLPPDAGSPRSAIIDTTAIYARRNKRA